MADAEQHKYMEPVIDAINGYEEEETMLDDDEEEVGGGYAEKEFSFQHGRPKSSSSSSFNNKMMIMNDSSAGGGGFDELAVPRVGRDSSSSAAAGKLFVGGISWETTEDTFSRYFRKYGEIIDSVIMLDKHSGRPRGFGFVTFADPKDAEKVLEKDHIIDNRAVEVKRTVPREDMQPGRGISRTKKIFVGGIPPSFSEDELKEYFSSYGSIVELQIMLDHNTGRSRGFGFVTFDGEDAVEKVISDGQTHELGGKQVEIKKAEPRRHEGDFNGDARQSYGSIRGGGGGAAYGGRHASRGGYGGNRGRGYGGYDSYADFDNFEGNYGAGAGGFYGGYNSYGFGFGYAGSMYGGMGFGGVGYGAPSSYGVGGGYGGGYGGGIGFGSNGGVGGGGGGGGGSYGYGRGYGSGNGRGGGGIRYGTTGEGDGYDSGRGYGEASGGSGRNGGNAGRGGGGGSSRYHPY